MRCGGVEDAQQTWKTRLATVQHAMKLPRASSRQISNHFWCASLQTWRAVHEGFDLVFILAHFSWGPSRSLFSPSCLWFSVSLSAHFLCPTCFLDGFWRQRNFDPKKGLQQLARAPGNFKNGGGGYNNLWSVAVLGHSASWSLVVVEEQRGSGWQLVTPCAQSAVANILSS